VSQNGPGDGGYGEGARPRAGRGEPVFTGPWPAVLLAGLILGLYAWQRRFPDQEGIYLRFGMVRGGEPLRLVTSMFVHGNWAHAVLNALGALAFGAGVSRLFGTRLSGALVFYAFFLVCGALASLGHVAVSPDGWLIGASGGVAGLMGAASRLLERRGGRLAPFTSPTVLGMAGAWIVLNLIFAVVGFPLADGQPIGWQAHLAGYAAGLLLIGPVHRLLRIDSAA
jgi:membrane associated rhomboid family serine protease